LGVPLTAETLANSDAQGSLGLYFHEGKDWHGNKSKMVMCFMNKHVTSSDTAQDYKFSGHSGAPQQFMHNCGSCWFQQIVNETCAFIATKLFAKQLTEMLVKLKSEDKEDKERKLQDLQQVEKDVVKLGTPPGATPTSISSGASIRLPKSPTISTTVATLMTSASSRLTRISSRRAFKEILSILVHTDFISFWVGGLYM
jgi:hypothetical protein